ncbi:MAG: RrF2 family transcriptional regulator [Planctomycetia bacterium]
MISRTSEYAIRSLSFMASRPRGEFHLALDMARELGIPAAFLGKVLQPLVVRGLLSSQRGRGGGFRLAQPAEQITLLSIVKALDQNEHGSDCGCPSAKMPDAHCCLLHTEQQKHEQQFHSFLERTTLAEMAQSCTFPAQPAAALPSGNGAVHLAGAFSR